jgi:hypothetical protein
MVEEFLPAILGVKMGLMCSDNNGTKIADEFISSKALLSGMKD